MAEHRGRDRVPLQGIGTGRINSSGKRFDFKVENYSINGMLLHVVKGTVPGVGEQVGLTVRADRLGEPPSRFTFVARVQRHEKRRNRILCGIEILDVRGEGVSDAMAQTYLEQYFSRLV